MFTGLSIMLGSGTLGVLLSLFKKRKTIKSGKRVVESIMNRIGSKLTPEEIRDVEDMYDNAIGQTMQDI